MFLCRLCLQLGDLRLDLGRLGAGLKRGGRPRVDPNWLLRWDAVISHGVGLLTLGWQHAGGRQLSAVLQILRNLHVVLSTEDGLDLSEAFRLTAEELADVRGRTLGQHARHFDGRVIAGEIGIEWRGHIQAPAVAQCCFCSVHAPTVWLALNHDDGLAQSSLDSVSFEQASWHERSTEGVFADQGAALGQDPLSKRRVLARVDGLQPMPEHRHGVTTGIERGDMRRSIDTYGQAAHNGYARGSEVARDLACHNRAPRGWCACPDYSEGVLQRQRTFHVEKERSVCGHPQQSWVAWPTMGEQLNARLYGLLAIGLSCSHCCIPRTGPTQGAGNTRVRRAQVSSPHGLNTVLGCSFAQRCSADAWKPAEGD